MSHIILGQSHLKINIEHIVLLSFCYCKLSSGLQGVASECYMTVFTQPL